VRGWEAQRRVARRVGGHELSLRCLLPRGRRLRGAHGARGAGRRDPPEIDVLEVQRELLRQGPAMRPELREWLEPDERPGAQQL